NVVLKNGVLYKNTALRDGELYVGDADGNYSQITSKNAKLGKVMIDDTGRISGVAAGRIAADSTDAVNGSQLHAVQQEAGKHTKVVNGSNITVEETDQDGQKTYKVGLNKDLLLGDITGKNVSISGTNGTIETTGSIATKDKIYAANGAKLADVNVTGDTISNDKSSVKLDKDGTVTINNKVTVDQNGKVSGVAAGDISDTSTDAVNGSQLKATNDRVSQVEGDITNIKSDITNIKGDVKNLGDRVTKVEQEAGKHTKVVNGSNVTVEETDQDGQKTYKVGLNKDLLLGDITGKNVSISGTNGTIETTGSIATKDKIYAANGAKLADVNVTGDTISNDKSSVKLDKDGTVTINNKVTVDQNGKVSGVAAGVISATSKDAVNGSQLFATNQQVAQNAQSISKLGNRINKVGAGAAALAALHPLDFDPDDKWDFAAGYGNYNGENAAAIGAYYRPNEDTMFSVGGSFGNGENMVNAGVSLKLGQGNHVSTSKVAMAKEIKDLRKELEGLKSALLDVNAGKKLDTSKLQLFPDVPKNHWAYEYVSTLKGNGVLTGYPDGEFKGDRPMTRYEFATMLYKAMLEGATLSDKILKEFAPELERFTVDTVHQDKDGKPTVERVRTVKAEK
uniref:S-layer homology domain-containing protein n=1 Tax=Dialister sp. TaxID=1955814 RepID=UPI003FF085A5